MPAAPTLELTLYGPPRLSAGGVALRLGSRKAIALCAVLVLDGARSREQLASLLWPGLDSAAARRNLRRDLFRLREAGVRIDEREDGAVALSPPALSQAPSVAERIPLQGLDGLSGEDFEDWLARARSALVTRRRAEELRSVADARQRGEVDEALRRLDALLDLDPCDEGAAMQAVALLQGRGDGAAALALVRRVEDALRRQFDLPVSAALRKALGHDAAVAPPLPRPALSRRADTAPLVPDRVPYVERSADQQRVLDAWSRGQRVYLSGAAGAGKSRLARELASLQGGWLRLSCEPSDTLVPYASAVRALRALIAADPAQELPAWVRRELAQLLPELGPAPAVRESDESRARLAAAYAAAFAALVADNFKALVFDDWHWVDPASLELWAGLELPPGVALLRAYRSAQLPAAALQLQRAEVDRGQALQVVLAGFDEAQTLALVRSLSGSAGGVLFSRRLQRATDGNPFFLLETLRHLHQLGLLQAEPGGGWRTPFDDATTDYAELPVPPTVRDAVRLRVRALGDAPQRLLEAASLLGDEVDLHLLDEATTLGADASIKAIEHAVAAQLVVADGARWHFAHHLVRQCLEEGLGPARRRMLHQRFARSLELAGAAPAVVASHRERAGDVDAARAGYRVAAEAALQVHALAQALAHWADLLRCGARGAEAVSAHLAIASLHARRGDPAAAAATLDAADAAAGAEAADVQAQVLLARAELWAAGRTAEAIALLDRLQPMLGLLPRLTRSRALQLRARVLSYAERLPEADALLRQAIELLDGVPEQAAARVEMLDTLARMALRAGDIAVAATAAGQAVALLEDMERPALLSYALVLLGVTALFHGRIPDARQALERARDVARRCGEVPAHRSAILNLVKLATDAGDAGAAAVLLDEGEALAPGFEHVRAEQAFREARFYVHYLRGELDAARRSALRLIDAAERVAGWNERIGARHVTVDLFLLSGDLSTAAGLLDEAQRLCDAQRDSAGSGHFQTQQAAKQAWLCWAEGRPRQALALLDTAPPSQRQEDRIAMAWIGAAAALDLDDADAARERLGQAVPAPDAPTDQAAMWLVQRLRLARRAPDADEPQHRERARALVDSGRLPAQMAERLRTALAT